MHPHIDWQSYKKSLVKQTTVIVTVQRFTAVRPVIPLQNSLADVFKGPAVKRLKMFQTLHLKSPTMNQFRALN